MKKFFPFYQALFAAFFLFSCASIPAPESSPGVVSPEARPETPGEEPAAAGALPESPAVEPGLPLAELPQAAPPVPEIPENPLLDTTVPPEEIAALPPETRSPEEAGGLPIRPEYPPVPERILGIGRIPYYGLALFLLSVNPDTDAGYIEDLALYYTEEAAQEGVNHDVAFAQMCLETGFLRFGGLVTPDMNNFCGLGSIGPGQPGEQFSSPRIGARAHIQHLKAYATDVPLRQELVDPRRRYVRYGSAPTLDGLTGSWAADREYSKKIRAILERLYAFAFAPLDGDALAIFSIKVESDVKTQSDSL
jgi:hypothetical protein